MPSISAAPSVPEIFQPVRSSTFRISTYRYSGSLTTPGCDEGVNWILMETPITLSSEQIEEFRAIFSGEEFPFGNRRPTQPHNGRTVAYFH